MATLPTKAQLVSKSVTKGSFKSSLSQLVDYLSGLLGSGGDAVSARNTLGIIGSFAVYPNTVPDLTVKIDAGKLFLDTVVVQGVQTLGGFTATSSNQRIDRVVLDRITGVASRVAGAENASPAAPAIPTGAVPLAQVGPFTVSTVAVTTAMITDERAAFKGIDLSGVPQRQIALLGSRDTNGAANFLSAGAGLNYNLSATATPLVLAFAAGYYGGGSKDLVSTLSLDMANQGSLALSNTSYIYGDYLSSVGITTYNTTSARGLVPWFDSYTFDRSRQALLNFEGTNGATTTTDDFGNTWTLTGATISTAQFKFGASSLVLSGGVQFAKSTNYSTLGDGSWEVSCQGRFNALPGSGTRMSFFSFGSSLNPTTIAGLQLYLFNNAGTSKLEIYASSNGTAHDIAGGTVGTNTTWATATWYKVRAAFDALGGTIKVYLSIGGAAETLELTVSTSAKICAISKALIGIWTDEAASGFNGWIDAFRVLRCVTNTSTETPAVVAPLVGDYPVHWFSIPEMVMYEVTAASASAGVNPGMTARNRLPLGEVDTNATVVTAARPYAYRGEYISPQVTFVNGVANTWSHNIGSYNVEYDLWLVNVISERNYSNGDRLPLNNAIDAAAGGGTNWIDDRNTVGMWTSNYQITNKNTAASGSLTYTSWRVEAQVRRAY